MRASGAKLFAAAACLLASAGGCESVRSSAIAESPLWQNHPGGALSIVLRRPVTVETKVIGERYERGRPEIDAKHRRVFVGSSDNGLYAIAADSGDTLYRFETKGAVQSEPLYDATEDTLYFGSNDGALYKVRASDGQLLWRFSTNAEVARKPVIQNGVVYVVNANDTLIAIDAKTGQLRWHQHRTPAFGMEIAGYSGPALGRDKVYVGFSDGVVMAYSTDDGSEQWPSVDLAAEAEQSAGGEVPRYLDVDTTPIVDRINAGQVVFVAGYAGGVFALDADNGALVWRNDRAVGVTDLMLWQQPAHAPRQAGPEVPARKVLIASSGVTGLWALDPNDGHMLWRRKLPEGGISAPVAVQGALLVGTTRYGLFLFSPLDGALIDGIQTGSGFAMTPAAYGRRAFVMSNGGSLLSLYVDPPKKG